MLLIVVKRQQLNKLLNTKKPSFLTFAPVFDMVNNWLITA